GEKDRIAGDVLRVAFRVAVLRVDREDEALQDVEALVAGALVADRPRDQDRVAAARLRLLERPGGGRQQHGYRRAVIRIRTQTRLVPGTVPVVVVEEPEVVDVDERHSERLGRGSRRLDRRGQVTDERTVVEDAGQRIDPGRLHESRRLPGQTRLSGPEHQEQERRGDETARQ